MPNWKPLAFESLHQKARILQQIRAFFLQQNILEVSTPLINIAGTTDPTIESLSLQNNQQTHYLQTSPEFFMKRLLAAGSGSIYQIAHAFREEQQGPQHLTEFTLLEWYVLDWDYEQLMPQIERLISALLAKPVAIPVYTYAELFLQHLGFNPFEIKTAELRKRVPDNLNDLTRDGLLDYCISIEIFPKLKSAGWFFIKDYPASQASLAKLSSTNPKVAERFEMFYNGLELANGFSELQDANEQLQRFKQDNQHRNNNQQSEVPIDKQLIAALEHGLPKCSGVAIGLERLMMVLLDKPNIADVGLN